MQQVEPVPEQVVRDTLRLLPHIRILPVVFAVFVRILDLLQESC